MSCFSVLSSCSFFFFFFFNDTATTEIYTLSLHDALPISPCVDIRFSLTLSGRAAITRVVGARDRKSTRLNSSHDQISYAVFCLKKKKEITKPVYRSASRHPGHRITASDLLEPLAAYLGRL